MDWKPAVGALSKVLIFSGFIAGVIIVFAVVGGYHASGNPLVCGSCHSMDHVYGRWEASMHKQFACIECHLPDTNLAGKIGYKVKAGLNDLYHEIGRAHV